MKSLWAILALLALSACAGTGGAHRTPAAWIAASSSGDLRFGPPYPTLVFDGRRVSGSGSCNRYTADVAIEGGRFDISNLAATEMACAPPIMEQEALFFRLLGDAVAMDGSQPGVLVLRTNDGRMLRFRSAPPQ